MKKYFAKYLPVEEEIKEGDVINRINAGITKVTTSDVDLLSAYNKDEGVQKVKLFLCSRDIQVGDKVKAGLISSEDVVVTAITENHLEGYKLEDSKLQYPPIIILSNLIKVIGEISPDALAYVKEGDEFDEDEVKIIEMRFSPHSNRWTDTFFAGNHLCPPKQFVRIKGPCGHFH